ncbi:NTF2-related export protein [Bradysia coprophila]|uniref:NTF2-related export protein n=1 Tax=Bradysia coprophila TaxID=38358 RepID=UPI00187DC0E6|nr:NTF2-related export protein [Bradysia coprophila]
MDPDVKSKIDQSYQTADEFTKVYYDSVDKKRHQMSRLYLDNGLLVWNGNESSGKENIQKYFLDLPTSIHNVITLDTQPIIDESTTYAPTFIIQVSGSVKFQDNAPKPFQQSFMITAQGDKWKIATDCFRLQDALNLVEKK